jgi:MYXO-CTERM domain-containing protein
VVVQLKQAPVLAIKPTGEEVELAQVVTPPPAQALVADASTRDNDRSLPQTASPLPLIGLFGLLLLGGAVTLRFVERRAL